MPRAAAALLLTLVGCDTTVHVRLSYGTDPLMEEECNAAVTQMQSFLLELEGEGESQEQIFRKCITLQGGPSQPTTLAELEEDLAGRIVFDGVPDGQRWTVWAEGFGSEDCVKFKTPLFCGMESDTRIPPPDGEVLVGVYCVADPPKHHSWSSESLQQLCRVN
jgi:hypothetical protein